jgi:hypothetical protein
LSKENLNELDQKTVNRYLSFDDKTIWPKGDKMPKWLNPKEIMQIGKTPGLNIKQLHVIGIDGRGVNIAIIDQGLPKHSEYQDNIVFYNDFSKKGGSIYPSMHGAAVASIAVGKTVGVAPGAGLYYFSAQGGRDSKILAIYKILETNKTLPAEKKIAVISISRGFDENDEEFNTARKEAKKQNVVVFYTNDILSLNRNSYITNPDNSEFYTLWPTFWGKLSYENAAFISSSTEIKVPTDFRVLASPTGYNDWVAYANGGLSWGVPYYAGVYALAKQVYPALTAEEFEEAARSTAQSKKIKDDETGAEAEVKYFINPVGLIEYFQKKSAPAGRKAASENNSDIIIRQNLKEAINKAVEGGKADKQPARKK